MSEDESFELAEELTHGVSTERMYYIGKVVEHLNRTERLALGKQIMRQFEFAVEMIEDMPEEYPFIKRKLPNIKYIS